MADLQTTIALVFEGVDRTGDTITGIGSNLKSLEQSVGDVTGPLAGLADTALKTEAAIITMAAAMAGVAINEAGKFSTAVEEIGTLFNGTNEQVVGLSDEILDYARTSTASIEQINASVYKAISTGTDYAKAVKLVADAEVLATAGRADLGATTELLTSSLNAYGAGTLAAADYSDVLFTAVQTGNTTLPELAANLTKVTGIASSADVPFDVLNAAVSALTISAGNTAESTTLLKALLTELISPSAALSEALDGLTLKGDGFEAVMQRLLEVTGGDAAAMAELFGNVRALQAALTLAKDASGAFSNALDAQSDRAGKAQAANDALTESFESTNQNLLNNLSATIIDAGLRMLDGYKEVAEALGDIFSAASVGFDTSAFTELFQAIDGFSEDAAAKLRAIAEALPEAMGRLDFSGLLEAFAQLGTELSALFQGVDLTTAEGLSVAIQAVVDSIETLTRVSAGVVQGLQPFIQKLGELITYVNNTDEGAKNTAGSILGLAKGVNTLLPLVGGLGDVLTVVGGGLAVIGGAKSAGVAVTGLGSIVGVLAGPAGLLALVSALGVAVGATAAELYNWARGATDAHEVTDEMRKSMLAQLEATQQAAEGRDELTEADQRLKDAEQAVADVINRDSNLSFEEQVQRLSENAAIKEKLEAINGKVASSEEDVADAYGSTNKSLDLLTDAEKERLTFQEKIELATQRLAERQGLVVDSTGKLKQATGELSDSTEKATGTTDKQTEAQKKQAEELEKSQQAAQEFQLELEKLASNERIRAMELKFDLDLEKLKQEGEKAIAIIEGIGTTVESTGNLLGDLFGLLAGDDLSRMDELDLERQIDLENQRREEALEQQAELSAQQVELLKQQARLAEARADAVARGEHLINVQAEGLTPALEIVFEEILKYAQIQASQEGAEFLLGLGA